MCAFFSKAGNHDVIYFKDTLLQPNAQTNKPGLKKERKDFDDLPNPVDYFAVSVPDRTKNTEGYPGKRLFYRQC